MMKSKVGRNCACTRTQNNFAAPIGRQFSLEWQQILGRYFCIWRCQNKVQGLMYWGNIVEVSLDRLYTLGMARFYPYVVLQNGFP